MSLAPQSRRFEPEEVCTCPVCLAEFVAPVSCCVCSLVACSECIFDLLGGACVRCKNRAFRRADVQDLAEQHLVRCSICGWKGRRESVPEHRCSRWSHEGSAVGGHAADGKDLALLRRHTARFDNMPNVRDKAFCSTSPRLAAIADLIDVLERCRTNGQAWLHLGEVLEDGEEVIVGGVSQTKVNCFATAIGLSSLECPLLTAWEGLGKALGRHELCYVQGVAHNRRDCFVRAVQLNEGRADLWQLLGAELSPSDVIVLSRFGGIPSRVGMELSAMDCFLYALRLDPTHAPSYAQVAKRLPRGGVVHVNGETLGKLGACRLALKFDPSQSMAWEVVATTLEPGERFATADGTLVDRGEAMELAQVFEKSTVRHVRAK